MPYRLHGRPACARTMFTPPFVAETVSELRQSGASLCAGKAASCAALQTNRNDIAISPVSSSEKSTRKTNLFRFKNSYVVMTIFADAYMSACIIFEAQD
jgi:hypothetical protein